MEIDTVEYNKQFKYIHRLPEDVKNSLVLYTTAMYKEINEYLDNDLIGTNQHIDNIISNIDSAFKNVPPLTKSIILYRGFTKYFTATRA